MLQKNSGDKVVDTVKVSNVIGGMKDLDCMFYPCSQLDAMEGIRFRGHTIPEMAAILPKVTTEMIPEGVFWLLLTGHAPDAAELAEIQSEMGPSTSLLKAHTTSSSITPTLTIP